MYIDKLIMQNIRTFEIDDDSTIEFVHPDMDYRAFRRNGSEDDKRLPKPKLANVNLLLGDNASGKTTVLQAIALAALGPAVREAKLPYRRLVRRSPEGGSALKHKKVGPAYILAVCHRHPSEQPVDEPWDRQQDDGPFESMQELERRGEVESMEWSGIDSGTWLLAYESMNAAFFCAAYGAHRRVESVDSPDLGVREKNRFPRLRECSAYSRMDTRSIG